MNHYTLSLPLIIVGVYIFLCEATYFAVKSTHLDKNPNIIYQTDTSYSRILVYQKENLRWLSFSEGAPAQSIMDVNEPHLLIAKYIKYLSTHFTQAPWDSTLFIGLGGGSLPGWVRQNFPSHRVEICEIDPDMIELAKRFFNFDPQLYSITTSDARIHLREQREAYDFIVLDAYSSCYIPPHLTTLEFFKQTRGSLTRSGTLLVNIANPTPELLARMINTIASVYADVSSYEVPESSNIIVIAKGVSTVLKEPYLTDNYAPVQYLMSK